MRRPLAFALTALLATGCVGPSDNPSTVHDLRVLAVAVEPSEVLAPTCELEESALAAFAVPIAYRALIIDPAGAGRTLDYALFGCADPRDRACSETEERALLSSGTAPSGELTLTLSPALALLDDGTPLLQKVLELDDYRGLGGLRVPLVLRVRAGDEEIYAQKLLVFGCRFFPEMQPNVTPVLPGVTFAGEAWPAGEVKPASGPGPFELTPLDFSPLEEAYVVPSFELQPVNLAESWELSWYTSSGTISPNQTGGTTVDGVERRHRVEWSPPDDAVEGDVTFWIVVRDGRGGTSWLTRTAHHLP